MYDTGRFFTVTGLVDGPGQLRDIQMELTAFHARLFDRKNQKRSEPKRDFDTLVSHALSDTEVIEVATRSANGAKFDALLTRFQVVKSWIDEHLSPENLKAARCLMPAILMIRRLSHCRSPNVRAIGETTREIMSLPVRKSLNRIYILLKASGNTSYRSIQKWSS